MQFHRILFFLLFGLICGKIFGQLSLEINPITEVLVGGGFQVSGRIVHDANSSNITAGTPIQLDIEIQDPSGNPVATNPTQIFSGGFSGGQVQDYTQSFQMPWSEDDKWTAAARWRVVVEVNGGGSPQGNITFPLRIPDLSIASVNAPTTATPGSYVTLGGIISNRITATEPQSFFRIEASIVGSNITESIIFPDPANFPINSNWPVEANADLNFFIPNFFIPETATDPIQVNIQVDPANPDIIPEENPNNNSFNHTINIVTGNSNIGATVFFDAVGTYQGLDPIKFKLVARNTGTAAVANADNFNLTVVLSEDNQFSTDDYILRQIDVGGGANGLGSGLLPNETITVNWVQMLPDNFEGDFYVLVRLNNGNNPIFASLTPEISLRSEETVGFASVTDNQTGRSTRPATSDDGKWVTFESMANGFNQIFLYNFVTDQTTLVTQGLDNLPADGDSYAPDISGDGRYVVFHSFASNLVNGDKNRHSDVFIYNVYSSYLAKVSNGVDGPDANEGSFYPCIDQNGSHVAFESEATNIDLKVSSSGGRQIYLFDHNTTNGSGENNQITHGNGDSFDASMDDNGSRIVFTTFADNLVQSETDTNGYSDVILWDEKVPSTFFFVARSEKGELPEGDTKEPVISGNGEIIAFVSSGTNMVSGKGIAHIKIHEQGLGYSVIDVVNIDDTEGNGTGAEASLIVDTYGAVQEIVIDNPGRDYVKPSLSISSSSREVNATATPYLVNLQGDIFRISTQSVKNKGVSSRVSESKKINGLIGSEYGGNERSREPSIDRNGRHIAFSTMASNLLDLNLTSTSKKVFPNLTFRPATAQAVLHGGIGKIIIANPGSGYPASGNFLIQDLSGNGSGAVASYQVDSNGGIGSITIINAGSGYDLSQTIVSIQNPGTGTGFQVAQLLFPAVFGSGANRTGGASVQRIEMINSGIGYPQSLHQSMQTPEILVDGDGVDTDNDGQADSKINSDRIHFGQNGEVYLEQHFEISLNNLSQLPSTTLEITDQLRMARGMPSLILSFDNAQFPPPFTISTSDNNLTSIRNKLIDMINSQWTDPQNLFEGPQIDHNLSGGTTFSLKALSGRVMSNNPTALGVKHLSNMLIQGSGFSRATAQITPSPVIHGFSELSPGMNTTAAGNGRPLFQFQPDVLTDDIYLYDHDTTRNQRISVSKFGFPTNFLSGANMPSHRFPSLSQDARYVFFSSDAGGQGGIIFNDSNQDFNPDNNRRDIFVRDMKSHALFNDNASISISEEILNATNHKINLNSEYPILISGEIKEGSFASVALYVNGQQISNSLPNQTGSQAFNLFIPWTPSVTGSHVLIAEIMDNLGNKYVSKPVLVTVIETKGIVSGIIFLINPKNVGNPIFLREPTLDPATGLFTFQTTGPHTRAEIEEMVRQGEIAGNSLAFYQGQGVGDAVPFFEIYPFRALVTNGSSLTSQAKFVGRDGRQPTLSKVTFFLNGKKLSEQSQPPYKQIFEPPSLHDDGKSVSFRWALTALAEDTKGNSFLGTEYGQNQFSEIMPVMQIDLVNGISGLNQNQILDSQVVTIDGEIVGSHEELLNVQNIIFTANGIVFADSGQPNEVQVNIIRTSTNNIFRITCTTLFDVEFDKYAKPDGSLEITAFTSMTPVVGYVPIFKSNSLNLNIAPPMPWVDETSNVLTLFGDLTFRNPSSDEITYALDHFKQEGAQNLENWINGLTSIASVSDRIDIVSAHRVIFGEWHSEFKKFENSSRTYNSTTAATPVWLKTYIDEQLESADYRFKYGNVPFLVGDFSNANVTNFLNNRYEFIKRCYFNKYGQLPSLQQLYQGSYNLLEYWATLEPTYWELPNSSQGSTDVDSPPRRDAVATGSNAPPWDSTVAYNPGDVVSLNQFEFVCVFPSPPGEPPPGSIRWNLVRIIGFASGELATDFIWRFAKEVEFFNGIPYIQSTSSIRNSHFKLATLMHLLWRENADILTDADINPLSSLPTLDAISKILSDPRYTSRFNLIWKNASLISEDLPNWKNEEWFGDFWDVHFPWVFHEDLGWIYVAGVSPTSFWLYSENLGWVWSGAAHYPSLYSNNEQGWIYFDKSTSLYYSYVTKAWKTF